MQCNERSEFLMLHFESHINCIFKCCSYRHDFMSKKDMHTCISIYSVYLNFFNVLTCISIIHSGGSEFLRRHQNFENAPQLATLHENYPWYPTGLFENIYVLNCGFFIMKLAINHVPIRNCLLNQNFVKQKEQNNNFCQNFQKCQAQTNQVVVQIHQNG